MDTAKLAKGINAYDSKDFETAYKLLLPLAQSGELEAQKLIARIYEYGYGREVDLRKAAKWYRLLAEAGDLISQNNLGCILIESNFSEGLYWLNIAADGGMPFSQEILGDIYSGNWQGIKDSEYIEDYSRAAYWYEKSAKKNFPISHHRLGEIYSAGIGVNKDEKRAHKHYLKAAKMGYLPSQKILAHAYSEGLIGLPIDLKKAKFWFDQFNHYKNK